MPDTSTVERTGWRDRLRQEELNGFAFAFKARAIAIGVIALLLAGVLLRATASKRLSISSPSQGKRPTASGADWEALWAARARWRRGWTDTVTPPESRS